MTDDVCTVRALLARHDPAPPAPDNPAHDAVGRTTFARILATPQATSPRRWAPARRPAAHRGRWAAAVTAAAVAAIAVALGVLPVGGASRSAYAATPPLLHYQASASTPTATVLLRQLAERAQAQPAPSTGRYHYLDLQTWALWTRVAGGEGHSRVVPAHSRYWIADDGSGKTETVVDGKEQTRTLAPGEWARMYDVGALSTDPATLAGQLAVGHPTSNGAAERFVAVTDLWIQQAPPPALQAAILRVLADQPGLVDRGHVTDRAGRPGVAVSVDSAYGGLPTRYTLIFDPATGMVLDYEETLTTTAGKLNVPIPSTISYTTWRGYGDVDHLGATPAPR